MSKDLDAQFYAAQMGDIPELDLHGLDTYMARHDVDAFLHREFNAGESAVRIVHGRGTGAMREMVHCMLAQSTLVEAYRDSDDPGELLGVTYALFRSK